MLGTVIGAAVSLFANAVYIDLRRKGRRRRRVAAFLVGFPLTLVWKVLIPEGRHREVVPPPDNEDALLREVRRDRALRAGRGDGGGTNRDGEPGPEPPS